jgi:hypothetical protein
MKRKLLIVCAFVGMGSFLNAQTTMVKNDNGQVITPEAGDWALGADASPILNYVGNMFNGSTANSLGNAFVNNNAIFGKYFVDENTAYRGSFRISTVSNKSNTLVDTNTAGGAPEYITNSTKVSGFGFYLSGGLEKRRGHGRLQGYYGGELGLGFGGTPKVTNEYGIDISATNPGPRPTETKTGATLSVGVRGFVGAEYFVIPKLSLGVEFGWGLSFSSTGEGEATTEFWNGTAKETLTTNTGKSSSFGFGTDSGMPAGSVRIMYHF